MFYPEPGPDLPAGNFSPFQEMNVTGEQNMTATPSPGFAKTTMYPPYFFLRASRLASFSSTRALTILVTSDAGSGLSAEKWRVVVEVR